MTQMLKVKMVKSAIARDGKQRKILAGMGLRRIGHERILKDNNCIRGMVNKVKHLVSYEIVEG